MVCFLVWVTAAFNHIVTFYNSHTDRNLDLIELVNLGHFTSLNYAAFVKIFPQSMLVETHV